MKVQIENQVIEIKDGNTFITVVRSGHQNYRHILNFDFRNYPDEVEKIKTSNRPEYYWLSNLYNDFLKVKPGQQQQLFDMNRKRIFQLKKQLPFLKKGTQYVFYDSTNHVSWIEEDGSESGCSLRENVSGYLWLLLTEKRVMKLIRTEEE